jgi:hypothetical protein
MVFSNRSGLGRRRPEVERLEDRCVPTGGPPPLSFLQTSAPMTASLAMHIHPHLLIAVDGVPVTIPANIGFRPTGWLPLHTHDATGTLHVESPVAYDFNLSDFFRVWNVPFTAQNFMGLPLDAGHTLTMTVNGAPNAAFGNYVLHDGDQIALSYNTAPATINVHFVDQVFHDLLHRAPDAASLYTLSYNLTLGRLNPPQLVRSLESSAEYQTIAVQSLFLQYLHRPADAATVGSFVAYLRAGGTSEQEAAIIIGADEYWKAHGSTVDGFLAGLYQDALGRAVDNGGKAYFTKFLLTGVTRTQVAATLLAGDEFGRRSIQAIYHQYLNRDADAVGLAIWLQARQHGLRTEQIVAAIVSSTEYESKAA